MDNAILAVAGGQGMERGLRLRIGAVVAGVAIVLATLIVVQHRADASPVRAAVATAAVTSAAAAVPQIDVGALIRSIVCPLLNSLAAGPFAFFSAIIRQLEISFGCITVSGTP